MFFIFIFILFIFVQGNDANIQSNSTITITSNGSNLLNVYHAAVLSNSIKGIDKNLYPTDLKFYEKEFTIQAIQNDIHNNATKLHDDVNIINGGGIKFKPSSAPRRFYVNLEDQEKNFCGILVGSGNASSSNIKFLQVYWKATPHHGWEILTQPQNGQRSYNVNISQSNPHEFYMTDPVPAKQLVINMLPFPGQSITLTIALLHSCQYPKPVIISSCATKYTDIGALKNVTGPINIKCPTFCSSTPECFGYKFYSTNSGVCYTAMNSLGPHGDGNLFIYPISIVKYFRTQMNSQLTGGTYCRLSTLKGPGYTFNRYYMDFANHE